MAVDALFLSSRNGYRARSRDEVYASGVAPFLSLVEEWIEINAVSSSSAAVRRWGRWEPVLEGFEHPWQVVDFVDESPVDVKDDVLSALIRLAQSRGQTLAARVVLQCLLPALRKMIFTSPVYLRRCDVTGERASGEIEERGAFVVAEAWIQIMSYSLERRPRRIAANLVMDTRKFSMSTPGRKSHEQVPMTGLEDLVDPRNIDDEVLVCDDIEVFSKDLAACLEWAFKEGHLDSDQVQLLTDVYLSPQCPDEEMVAPMKGPKSHYQAIGAKRGVSYAAVVKQTARARQQLVNAITEELLEPQQRSVQEPSLPLAMNL